MSLQELWQTKGYSYYPTDKGNYHSYLDVYTELFLPFRDKEINIIEIGIYQGGSMRLFSDWFTKARIIGYDITEEYIAVPLGRAEKIIKDFNNFSKEEFNEFPPHIIIDDSSHLIKDQLKIIQICYPQLQEGGILIIEDVQDIQSDKNKFDDLGIPYELYDLRIQKNRWDDVLLVYKK